MNNCSETLDPACLLSKQGSTVDGLSWLVGLPVGGGARSSYRHMTVDRRREKFSQHLSQSRVVL